MIVRNAWLEPGRAVVFDLSNYLGLKSECHLRVGGAAASYRMSYIHFKAALLVESDVAYMSRKSR